MMSNVPEPSSTGASGSNIRHSKKRSNLPSHMILVAVMIGGIPSGIVRAYKYVLEHLDSLVGQEERISFKAFADFGSSLVTIRHTSTIYSLLTTWLIRGYHRWTNVISRRKRFSWDSISSLPGTLMWLVLCYWCQATPCEQHGRNWTKIITYNRRKKKEILRRERRRKNEIKIKKGEREKERKDRKRNAQPS